ncbi:MAG: DUF2752 domain-containing protein [Verrucomicrobia bacterium]|nr:DUF2752 domain-containing protein [Verrucomicrobiota bacterium]
MSIRALLISVIIFILVPACIVVYVYPPQQNAFYPSCFFNRTTGLYCPGCGTLRALHYVLHGQIVSAIRSNLMFVILAPLFCWFVVRLVFFNARDDKQGVVFGGNRLFLLILAYGVLFFWILRNLPWMPFCWFVPQ